MLRVTHSNWTEALVATLGRRLPTDPYLPATVIVPNRAMERVVELGLARDRGFVGNVRFERLEQWLEGALLGPRPERPILGPRALLGRLLCVLSDPALEAAAGTDDPLAPVATYLLAGDGRWSSALTDRRRLELAPRLAQLFQEYGYSRPDWIRAWMRGQTVLGGDAAAVQRTERWQSALYRRARSIGPACTSFAEVLGAGVLAAGTASGSSTPVFVFGVSYVARVVHEALARIARDRDVDLLVVNPCRELWSDVGPRLRTGPAGPEELESRLLEGWGRPGREHVGALDEAVGYDTEARFVEPVGERQLARVQRSILERTAVSPGSADGSVVVLPCPSVRREVETVVSLVWGLLARADREAARGEGEPLRLNEVAILVPARDRETYLPHLEVVLEGGDDEAGASLPWSAQDLRLVARSRVAEAGLRLLAFFERTPTRREVLGLLAHPLVRASAGELELPSEREWAELADEVGIVRGIDEHDLRGTYADLASGEGRVLHFDQGLGRIALGAARGDAEEPDVDPLHAPRLGAHRESAMAFVTLVRSLLADHRALSRARLTLGAWATLLDRLLAAYVQGVGGAEEAELERCRAAVRGLGELDVGETRYGADLALGLAAGALEEVAAVRGEPQALGVVVASLLPMRAIPFRVVFVLGMGEGQFPEEGLELGLDLRRAQWRPGDVTHEERDRYAFLETLLSTRERLFLSYVARDEHTGDPRAPSSVVTELAEAAGGLLELRPPARRHEAVSGEWLTGRGADLDDEVVRAAMAGALGAAVAERAARARGDEERAFFRDVELPSEAWARLGPDDPRRVELALPGLPAAVPQPDKVVRVDVLRRFVGCPIQGRAEHWLRSDIEDDGVLLVDEEPLDAASDVLEKLARAAFEDALDAGLGEGPSAALARAAEAVVAVARGRGKVPVGVLGRDVIEAVGARAERWLRALREARPDARQARAVRLGRLSS
ncbi:MAG: exodeoxyribonuclease V subunit gamma, partial [Sandaracinaceae bacterium]|nr:exodeoxyribonuclease V subunit gamma [Sandaracinaceae bacterium]